MDSLTRNLTTCHTCRHYVTISANIKGGCIFFCIVLYYDYQKVSFNGVLCNHQTIKFECNVQFYTLYFLRSYPGMKDITRDRCIKSNLRYLLVCGLPIIVVAYFEWKCGIAIRFSANIFLFNQLCNNWDIFRV